MKKALYQFEGAHLPINEDARKKTYLSGNFSLQHIFIDVLQIEAIDESYADDYLTVIMNSGNAYLIKWKLEKLLKLIENSR